MSESEILKIKISQYETTLNEITEEKKILENKKKTVQKQIKACVQSNDLIMKENNKTEQEMIKTLSDINMSKINLTYKVEELKIFQESLELNEQKKHDTKIDNQNLKIDYSNEEKHFRELQSNVSLTLQNIKQSSLCNELVLIF